MRIYNNFKFNFPFLNYIYIYIYIYTQHCFSLLDFKHHFYIVYTVPGVGFLYIFMHARI